MTDLRRIPAAEDDSADVGRHRDLDPQCARVLKEWEKWSALEAMTVQALRARDVRGLRNLGGGLVEVAEVLDIVIPGPAGEIGARVYRPEDGVPVGILVWLHGGAWIMGSAKLFDDHACALAVASRCLVVSVDYRLAPEHPFPAGLEDCFAAVQWVADHRGALGAPEARIAIGGDSAGGNLAAVVTHRARDLGSPRLDFQLLVYPLMAFAVDTPSRNAFSQGYSEVGPDEPNWLELYLSDPSEATDPRVSPLFAESVADLPPALIVTAQMDPLCDEGEDYGRRLAEAGVPVQIRRYPGMIHGFMAYAGAIDLAADAFAEAGEAVRVALADDVPTMARTLRRALTRASSEAGS